MRQKIFDVSDYQDWSGAENQHRHDRLVKYVPDN